MISMTGFAQNDIIINNIKYNFSIRSLNSNNGLDVGVKIPRYLFNIESEIRKHINVKLVRGKVDFRILEASENNQIKIDFGNFYFSEAEFQIGQEQQTRKNLISSWR